RLAGERQRQLEPPLVAVRQDPARLRRLVGEADPVEQDHRLVTIETARRAKQIVVTTMMGEQRSLNVLQRGQASEDAGDLERARQAAATELRRHEAADLLA